MNRALIMLLTTLLLAGCTQERETAVDATPLQEPVAVSAYCQPQDAVIAIMGDLMVHSEQLRSAYQAESNTYNFAPSLEWVAKDIRAADLSIANLETVFTGDATGYAGEAPFNTPDSFADALREAGVDFLTTANNHCMDGGEVGLLRTLEVLDEVGIGHTGTFAAGDSRRASVVEVSGMRIALVTFTYGTNDIPTGASVRVNRLERETVRAVLRETAAQQPDWIIALPHMGKEYQSTPDAAALEWTEYLLANGADAVVSSHPHVLQPIAAKRGGALVAYSMGNFLSSQQQPGRDVGMLLKLHLHKDAQGRIALRKVSFLPVWVQLQDANGARHARVLPIGDALRDYESGNALHLRRQDVTRMQDAYAEIAFLYLQRLPARGSWERELVLYPEENVTATDRAYSK